MSGAERNRSVSLGDASLSFDEALDKAIRVQIRGFSSEEQPNLSSIKNIVLQKGTYVTKAATCWDIRSTNTGEYKFSNLVLYTLRRTKKRGWEFETHRSITIGDEKHPDAINKLMNFLCSLPQLEGTGEVIVFDATSFDSTKFETLLEMISGTGQQEALLPQVIDWIYQDKQALERLTQLSGDDLNRSQSLVAAINYGRYQRALSQLREMVNASLPEREYQKFLEQNYWIFGSEYSELLEKRSLVAGQQLDFPLRRTVDGYIDAIEIKTPLDGKSGFKWDKSHNNYFSGNEINKDLQQLRSYLSRLEAERDRLKANEGIDFRQVRGKLIVGRDGSDGELEALRLLNADSQKIEVMSFDGLLRLGQRILEIMVSDNPELQGITFSDPFNLDDNQDLSIRYS